MAFGMQTSGGNFLPIIKYDARAGRIFRVDKDNGITEQVDITDPNMKFAIDFGSIEVGYVQFSAQGPVRHMVPYDGRALPAQPQDKDDKGKLVSRPGFYALVAGQAIGGIREWCSNAAILLNALDELFNLYAEQPEAAGGKIPLISIVSTVPVTSGTGAQKSTNYKPVFKIVGWVDRLADMGERTVPPPAPKAIPAAAAPTAPPPAAPTPPPVAPAAATAPPAGMPF